jgi:hypothetical protein
VGTRELFHSLMSPVLPSERKEAAALQDFGPTYVADGSLLSTRENNFS